MYHFPFGLCVNFVCNAHIQVHFNAIQCKSQHFFNKDNEKSKIKRYKMFTVPFITLELIDFDAIVVSNGARIIYRNQRTDYGISLRSAEYLLNKLKHYPNLRITLETGDCAYSNLPIEDYETILSDDLVGIANDEGVLKILVHIDNEETLSLVKNELTDDLYYTIAHGYLMQIMNVSDFYYYKHGIIELVTMLRMPLP